MPRRPEVFRLRDRKPGDADRHRLPAHLRGYDTAWKRLRDDFIVDHPLCEDCLDEGITNAVDLEVDHVIPVDVRPDLRLVRENLRTRCKRHHRLKTLQDKKAQR